MAPDTKPWLIHHETMSLPTRVVLAFGSLIPLFGFHDLVIRPGGVVWSVIGLPFLAMGLVALALALALLLGAAFAPEQQLWADPTAQMLIDEGHLVTGHVLHRKIRFAAIQSVEVIDVGFSDGEPSLTLCLGVAGRKYPRRLFSRPVRCRADMDEIARNLRAMIGLRPQD